MPFKVQLVPAAIAAYVLQGIVRLPQDISLEVLSNNGRFLFYHTKNHRNYSNMKLKYRYMYFIRWMNTVFCMRFAFKADDVCTPVSMQSKTVSTDKATFLFCFYLYTHHFVEAEEF